VIFDHIGLLFALLGVAATLAVAIARPPWLSEAVVAVVSSGTVIASGAVSVDGALRAAGDLAPTIGFLATLLLLASGCRREGLFEALGSIMARNARDDPRRLLALVFVVSSSVTAVLGLDSTIVLLTPVVFATATRLRMNPKPHVYACLHLANSASLLLPVSNLTNLLAFHASGLSFVRFAALMAAPTAAAIAVEWVVLTRFFAGELRHSPGSATTPEPPHLPRFALGVLGATLIGFLLSAPLGIDPLWIATAGAALMTVGTFLRKETTLRLVVRAVEPSFLVFVLGLGVTVAAASNNGLAAAVRTLVPNGASLPDLLGIAAISAILANLINNLPATLIVTPAVATGGHFAALAALVGVNVGPNLTYVGSLATLLWRRLLRAEDTDVNLAEFVRLGAVTVLPALIASTIPLWIFMKLDI
jgi:arsenical pump membrane protein